MLLSDYDFESVILEIARGTAKFLRWRKQFIEETSVQEFQIIFGDSRSRFLWGRS